LSTFAFHRHSPRSRSREGARFTCRCGYLVQMHHWTIFPHGKSMTSGYGSVDDGLMYDLLAQSAPTPSMVINYHATSARELASRLEHRVRTAERMERSRMERATTLRGRHRCEYSACRLAEVTGGGTYCIDAHELPRRHGRSAGRAGVKATPKATLRPAPVLHVCTSTTFCRGRPPGAAHSHQSHADAVWTAILDGTVDTLATDRRRSWGGSRHPVYRRVGPSFPPEWPHCCHYLVITEGVHKRGP